jgi:hypothetical protein
MIDASRARLEDPDGCYIHQRKQSQLDCRGHKQAWHDRGKRSMLRRVFRIFLIMTIRPMVRIRPVMLMMLHRRGGVVMVDLKPPKHLMSKSHRGKQRDQEQQIAALAKQSHERMSDTSTSRRGQPPALFWL